MQPVKGATGNGDPIAEINLIHKTASSRVFSLFEGLNVATRYVRKSPTSRLGERCLLGGGGCPMASTGGNTSRDSSGGSTVSGTILP